MEIPKAVIDHVSDILKKDGQDGMTMTNFLDHFSEEIHYSQVTQALETLREQGQVRLEQKDGQVVFHPVV